MKTLFSFFYILLGISYTFSYGQTDNKYLVISPQGHRSTIYDAALDKNGNLITGSFDKTIKVWNLKNGSEIKSFRGEIGPGSEGMVYTVSISPDNKYLAAAGWFGKDDESEALGDIRVFNYETGKMYALLQFHENAVMDLAFTPQQTLISGDASGVILEWDIQNKRTINRYDANNEDFAKLAVCSDYFVTGHNDGMAYVWNYGVSKPVKKIDFFAKKKLGIIQVNVAVSPDGENIAVCGKEVGMVMVFNRKVKLESYFFTGDNEVIQCVFSPTGNRMILSIKESGKNHALVYEKNGSKWNEMARFNKHNDLVSSVGFVDENTCYSAGGEKNEIYTWKVDKPDKILSETKSNGSGFYAANLNGSEMAFSRIPNKALGFSDYTEVFDLFKRSMNKEDIDASKFKYPLMKNGAYELYSKYVDRYSTYDPNEHLFIKKNNGHLDSIPRYYWDGNGHNAYSIVNNDFLVTGGDYGMLEAYSMDSYFRGKLVGHEDGIRSVSVSENGKFIITGGLDMTLRVWKIEDLGKEKSNPNLISIWEYCVEMDVHDVYHNILNTLGLATDAKKTDVASWRKVIKGLEDKGYPCNFMKIHLSRELYEEIFPVVSIFIADNNEWVVWNNDGYFTSSKRGAKYVGYHINQGKDNEAKFYPFEQFDLKYNRPDIILNDLELADAGIIEIYERAYYKRLERTGLSEEDLEGSTIHAPSIEIAKYTTEQGKANFLVNASDEKFKLNRFNVYLNDVPIYGRKGVSVIGMGEKEIEKTFQIQLINGQNKIQFSVLNNKGVESRKETVYIENEDDSKGELYVVAIGVSSFKDEKYNLNYAAKDAEDVIHIMEENKAYEKINTLLFTNEKVTKKILVQVQEFFAQANTGDVVLLYIAGHGVLSSELDYYYATYDMDFVNPEQNGISYIDLEAIFDNISSIKKLLIMDTCHSGDLNKDDIEEIAKAEDLVEEEDIVFRSTNSTTTVRERQGLQVTNEMMKEMFNDINKGTGTTVISSAGGVEFAFESEKWKNGLFTYCLLNGLSTKKADYNKDGYVHLSELQNYITKEVQALSKGLQSPTARMENISLDYLIWN